MFPNWAFSFPSTDGGGYNLLRAGAGDRAVRGGGSHGPLRPLQRAARRRRGEESVQSIRSGRRNRSGVEPGQAPELRPRSGDDRPPLLGGSSSPIAAERQHHRPVRRVAGQRTPNPKFHNRGLHQRESQRVPEKAPAGLDQGGEEMGEADLKGIGLFAFSRSLYHPQRSQLQQCLRQWPHWAGINSFQCSNFCQTI